MDASRPTAIRLDLHSVPMSTSGSRCSTEGLLEVDVEERAFRRRSDSMRWQDVTHVPSGQVYVSHLGSNLVSVVDLELGEVVAELILPTAPAGLLVSR